MRTLLLFTIYFYHAVAFAQINQIIHTVNGQNINQISEIDSIRFGASGNEMQVIQQNGTIDSYAIDSIDFVDFEIVDGNTVFHSCGADSVHNAGLIYSELLDQSGYLYKSINIGDQIWMAENLNTDVYRNGDTISWIDSEFLWSEANVGAWCYYQNNSENQCPYGKLYNALAVTDARGLCPVGWRVPTESDWNELLSNLDSNADTLCLNCIQSNLAGNALKTAGNLYWQAQPLVLALNTSGFSALPAGFRANDGTFSYQGSLGVCWSSAGQSGGFQFSRGLSSQSNSFVRYADDQKSGFSVRCIKE